MDQSERQTQLLSTQPSSAQPARRRMLGLLAGAPLALAGLALAGCGNMRAAPKKPRPKSYITGRGGGPGSNAD